jgi:hypothetical protein
VLELGSAGRFSPVVTCHEKLTQKRRGHRTQRNALDVTIVWPPVAATSNRGSKLCQWTIVVPGF